MNKNSYTILDSAAGLYIPDTLDLFPRVKAQLAQRRTFMQTLRARPALAILLAVLALILLTGVAYAIGRSLGYIPGIGFVEPGVKLRVLAEPVNQTREGITVTIEQVVVDPERTIIIYKAEGLSLAAANSKGEGAPLGSAHLLRLPDGTLLQEDPTLGYDGIPEPLLNDLTTEGGWPNYVRRLVFPTVAQETNELTLVIPILQNMPAGVAPEDWEITFHLKPAPPDMIFAPILEIPPQVEPATTVTPATEGTHVAALSNTSTLNGITLSLDSVIEVEDGYVLTGSLSWDDSAFPNAKEMAPEPVLPAVSDGNGQTIPVEEVPLDAPYGDHKMSWSVRTDRKDFSGSLVFSIPSIASSYEAPVIKFDLDLGPNPQIGQTWELNRDFLIEGHTVRLLSARLVKPFSGCTLTSLEFSFKTDTDGIFTFLTDENPDPPGDYSCDSVNDESEGAADPTVMVTALLYKNIPNGLHHFSLLSQVPYVVAGPWQVAWNPPTISEPIPSSVPEICLTIDKWNQVIGQNDPLPEGLGGKVLTTVNEGGNLPVIYVNSLDGVSSQRIEEGSWPSLSSDGTRLIYSGVDALRMVDLASGQIFASGIDGYHALLSPDNSRILYTTTFNLYVVNPDGSGLQTIDTGAAQVIAPVGWLPDNQTIIYSAMGGDGFHYKSYNLQTGEGKELFVATNKAGFGAVSPDGQWIVFSDRVFGAIAPSTFIAKIDGSDRRQITPPEVISAVAAAWSPDGQWLIFNIFNPDESQSHVLVNPFTCQALHVNTIHGIVEDWSP